MGDKQRNRKITAQTLASLRQKALFAEGELHAFLFAHYYERNLARIEAEIQEFETAADHLTAHLRELTSDNTTACDYQLGYQAGLKRAAQIISAASPSETAKKFIWSVFRSAFASDGRKDAFSFALEKQGDLPHLQAEIESVEEIIAWGLARDPDGPMSPHSSPRWYRDGYLAGLREAIEIIQGSPEK